jgi:hypothetical protein
MAVVTGLDWRQTIAFVDQNGTEIERARLRGILGRPRPEVKVARGLEARQNADGGFPHGMAQGRLSTIDATAAALSWLEDLGLLRSPHAERALTFLLAAQRPDGSWDEPPGLIRYNPPPRLLPGDPRVRLLSTALAAFWLARLGHGRDEAVSRAMAYLRGRQAADGRFVGYLRATWLAVAVFRIGEGAASTAAMRGLDALAAVAPDRWRPGGLAAMLGALADAGVSADLPLIRQALARLAAFVRPDGSWMPEDGDFYRVEVALQALRAFLLYGTVSLAVEPVEPPDVSLAPVAT